MSKKLLIILLIIIVAGGAVIGGTFAWQYWQMSKQEEEPIEYKAVTIKELISDTAKYDGQKILVRSKFTDMRNRPIPMCVPIGTGENPEIKESYHVYPATWGISNQDGEVGVDVIDENAVHISTLPNYQEGQKIELRGVARATTVSDYCNYDVRYRSVYIEVNSKDIDITLKPKVTITTDKTEYEQGETVKIKISNILDENIFALVSSVLTAYSDISIEKELTDGSWRGLAITSPPPPYMPNLNDYTEINSGDSYESTWDQKIFNSDTGKRYFIESGILRVKFRYITESKAFQLGYPSERDIYPEKEDFITIYSNEFTIKEKEVEGKKFLYAIAQDLNYDILQYRILKIDPNSLKIIKQSPIFYGGASKIKVGKDVYIYNAPYREPIETFLTIYNKDLTQQLASYPFIIGDFEVEDNILYLLKSESVEKFQGGKTLEIIDLENPTDLKTLSSLDFEKIVHNIIFRNDKLYLLDNVVIPLYLHIIDVKEPKEPKIFTGEAMGINASLKIHDMTDNKWFVIMSYGHRGGSGIRLLVFSATPPIELIASSPLYSWSISEESPRESFSEIKVIKATENYLYSIELKEREQANLSVWNIQDIEDVKKISTILLTDQSVWTMKNLSPSLIKDGNLLYYGDSEGIFIIDITDPLKPVIKEIIKTDYPIVSLELSK